MSSELMRKAITQVYPGDSWKRKVKSMSDSQVLAIYTKFLHSGRLTK